MKPPRAIFIWQIHFADPGRVGFIFLWNSELVVIGPCSNRWLLWKICSATVLPISLDSNGRNARHISGESENLLVNFNTSPLLPSTDSYFLEIKGDKVSLRAEKCQDLIFFFFWHWEGDDHGHRQVEEGSNGNCAEGFKAYLINQGS